MKKIVSVLLCLTLVLGCLTGCKKSCKYENSTNEMDYAVAENQEFTDTTNYVYEEPATGYEYPEEFNTEEYNDYQENGFKSTLDSPISTLSADVDTASYSNVRRMLNDGWEVDPGAVRIEEMINYFDYDYETKKSDSPFSIYTEASNCSWNKDTKLLLIGLKTDKVDFEETPDSNLVFLIDVSGSMFDEDKLPLVQQSFNMLVNNLTEKDRVSIVTYAGSDSVVLRGARGDEKNKITTAINQLEAGGGTYGSAGIVTAYEIAKEYFIEGGNNRVILATDGDLNVGLTSESELTNLITEKKKSGVYLSVLGFGTENIKDNKMEALADNGNGNYSYIDSLKEAKKVLVNEMSSTLVTIAEDVKLQVEFNPNQIKGYRLIGYENRLLNTEDFNDDTKDAGEIGRGHCATFLYEIALKDSSMEIPTTQRKYGKDVNTDSLEWLTFSVRYKEPGQSESKLFSQVVSESCYRQEMTSDMNFVSCIAQFGMLLKDSEYKGNSTYDTLKEQLTDPYILRDTYKMEFVELVNISSNR